jgi:hypothetical protein
MYKLPGQRTAPEAPEAGELPEVPPAGAWWSGTPGQTAADGEGPQAAEGRLAPEDAGGSEPRYFGFSQQEVCRRLLEQMRAQMDEIRAQMQDLPRGAPEGSASTCSAPDPGIATGAAERARFRQRFPRALFRSSASA